MATPSGEEERPVVAVPEPFAAGLSRLGRSLTPVVNFFRSEGWRRFVDGFQRMLEHPVWGQVAQLIERASLLPPNLEGIRALTLVRTEQLASEGVTIYVVPRTATARRLLLADTPAARRAVLGERYASILDDCDNTLVKHGRGALSPYARLVRRAIDAARDGHTEAAQALGANLVDSLLVHRYGWSRSRDLTSHKKTTSDDLLSRFAVAEYMVLAPIRASYAAYWAGSGDPVPRNFSRHVTAHHAAPRQFSRRNVAQVVMQATALIALTAAELDADSTTRQADADSHADD